MERKRVVARVEGLVQGVYFRDYAQNEARRLGLSGWVRNRADGSVEVVLEGEVGQVEAMLTWLASGSPLARVDRVTSSEERPLGDAAPFAIRYN